MQTKVFAYCRKSSEDKDHQVNSIKDQITWCKEEAEKRWLFIDSLFTDEKTWTKPHIRDWFNEMVDEIIKFKWKSIILTWELSRLSRNPIDWWTIQHYMILEDKIEIYSSTWSYNRYSNLILLWVLFWQSAQYSVDLSRNVKRWLKWVRKNWRWTHKAPIWYLNNKTTNELQLDPERVTYINKVYEYRLQWHSYSQIADFLYEEWFRTNPTKKCPVSKKVWATTIEKIIKKKFYCWIMQINDEEYKWNHIPIIDIETWESANKINKLPVSSIVRKNTYHYAFKWVLKCDECWSTLTAYKKKWHVYYACKKNKWIRCKQWCIREESVEFDMIEKIQEYKIPTELADEWIRAVKDKQESERIENDKIIDSLNKQLHFSKKKAENLLDLRIEWWITTEWYNKKLAEIDLEKNKIKEKLSWISEKIERSRAMALTTVELLKNPLAIWNSIPYEKKEELHKIIWSNIFVRDKKLVSYRESELFDLLKSDGTPDGWGSQTLL